MDDEEIKQNLSGQWWLTIATTAFLILVIFILVVCYGNRFTKLEARVQELEEQVQELQVDVADHGTALTKHRECINNHAAWIKDNKRWITTLDTTYANMISQGWPR